MTTPAHHDLSAVRAHPYREILRLAAPLILSMSGLVLMQFVDGLFLSWYSPEALAAAGSAGIASYLLISLFQGTAGYASAFIAQFSGAGEPRKIGPAAWQSIYLSLAAGFVTAGASFLAKPLFGSVGHDPAIVPLEADFFRVTCLGGWAALLSSALSTFFTGRGDTRPLMRVQIGGFVLNGILAYGLIFGHLGLPRLGVTGAALATVLAQAAVAAALAVLFLGRREHRVAFATWEGCRFDAALFKRLVVFGMPNGFRFSVEMLSWVVFVFFVGRIGTLELACTNIAWRINGIAFFPIIGLAQAVGILVGHAQGQSEPDVSVKVAGRGMVVAEAWMLGCAVLFLAFPRQFYGIFAQGSHAPAADTEAIAAMGTVLLRFVAAYCSLDAANMVYVSALQYAGDTRWTFKATLVLHATFITSLVIADRLRLGLMVEWTFATIFVMLLALVWIVRFYHGAWKGLSLLEKGGETADGG